MTSWPGSAGWPAPARSATPGTLDPMATGVLVLGLGPGHPAADLPGRRRQDLHARPSGSAQSTVTDDAEGDVVVDGRRLRRCARADVTDGDRGA